MTEAAENIARSPLAGFAGSQQPSPANPALADLPRFDIVFLDMDDVLCEWMVHAVKLHDRSLDRIKHSQAWKPGDGRDVYEILGYSKQQFWGKIDESPSFWRDLPKTAWFKDLINIAHSLSESVQVLTKPHNHEHCYSGKHKWWAEHLCGWGIRLILAEDKSLLAAPGRLLIDDRDENCEAFRAAGGSAILFPQHWNSAHDKAPFGPLFYLAQELAKLAAEQRESRPKTEFASGSRITIAPRPDSPIARAMHNAGDLPMPFDPASHDGKEAESIFGARP